MDLAIGQIIYINENESGTIDQQVVISSENVKQLKKPSKTRSPVYKFFEWDEEVSQWKCIVCKATYSLQESGSTGSLVNHMKRKHASMFNEEISKIVPSKVEKRLVTKEIFRQKISQFIVCCDEPFSVVESPYFIDLIDYCSEGNEACKLFSAKTAKEHIDKLFIEFKADLKTTLQSNAGKISFVIDCWTSSNQHPFQGFTKQMRNFQKNPTDDDLKRYLAESVVDPDMLVKERTGINGVLGWWKIHAKEFPILSIMAKDFLAASGSGIPVERLFSSGPDILQPKRQCLSAETIQKLVCLKSWLKAGFEKDIQDAQNYKMGIVPEPK